MLRSQRLRICVLACQSTDRVNLVHTKSKIRKTASESRLTLDFKCSAGPTPLSINTWGELIAPPATRTCEEEERTKRPQWTSVQQKRACTPGRRENSARAELLVKHNRVLKGGGREEGLPWLTVLPWPSSVEPLRCTSLFHAGRQWSPSNRYQTLQPTGSSTDLTGYSQHYSGRCARHGPMKQQTRKTLCEKTVFISLPPPVTALTSPPAASLAIRFSPSCTYSTPVAPPFSIKIYQAKH